MADNFWEKDTVVQAKNEWWNQDKVVGVPETLAPPVKDAGFSLGDIAKSFGIGAVGSAKALTDVAGAENVVSSKLGKGVEGLQESLTPERQAELQRQAARMKAAEESGSLLQEIKAGALNVAEAPLQSAAQAIGSFVPYLLTTPVAAAMRLTGASKAVIEAVAKQAPKAIATAQGAGAVKGSIYDGVLRAEIEAGVDPETAKQKADQAQSYFGGNLEQIALGGGLGYIAGSKGVEELFSKVGRNAAAPGMARRVGEAVVKESLPEAAQGGQERLAQNIALQREGYDVDTFKGVAGQATQEALTGALGAAPIAAVSKPEAPPVSKEADAFKQEEEQFRKDFAATQEVKPVAAPVEPEKPTEYPGGYTATRREVSREDVPESFGIFPQGADKPLTTVATQEEADKKLQTLTQIRAEEQAKLLAESDKITAGVNDALRKLEVMEATGQTDTDQYVQAKALQSQFEEDAAQKIKELNDRIVNYSTPLTATPMGTRTNVQSEYVVNKGQEPIGTFKTLEEVQAALQQREPEVFKQAEAASAQAQKEARRAEFEKVLTPMLAKFNLQDVGLKIVDKIKNDAGGSYLDRLIQVSLDEAKPMQTMRHESMHALRDLGFFTPQQWNVLTERANKQWIKEYLENQTAQVDVDGKMQTMSRLDAYKRLGLTQEEIVEEAVSDAFGAYDKGATPPPGMIAALFKKLKNFFLNFGQALRGAGFESADDVFQRVERGELKSRKPKAEVKAEPKAQPKAEPKAEEPAEKEPVKAEPEAEEPTKPSPKPKLSLAGQGVPMSTRKLMEQQTPVSQQDLGLNTEEKRGRFNNVRDIAKALNNQTLEQLGAMDRNKLTQDESTRISEAIADEVAYQLQTSSTTGTGLGWYSNNYPNAVKRLGKRFPELSTSKYARSVFSAIVAVTSNGERVAKNIDNAIKLYSELRKGKPLVAMGNRRATALENNLKVIEDLMAEHGEDFEKVLLKEITVKEMNARLREMGEDTDGSYLANTVVPAAAVYFGPKLGAFYANLSGSEGYLTMDLWWTRSINRMRGLLIPKATEASITKFRDMMESPGATRDEVVAASIPLRNKYEEYGWNSELEHLVSAKEPAIKAAKPAWFKKAEAAAGDAYEQLLFEHNLEKMANTIYKNEFEMLEEAPFTATDRKFMYDAARKAQTLLRNDGIDLSLADIQAALWYYEKRLYAKLSGRKADDIGYEEAIIAQADQGSGRARPSVVFDKAANRRDDTGAEVSDTEEVGGELARGEKLSLRAPTTQEFKRFLGSSQVVNKNGEAAPLFHATYSDFTKPRVNYGNDEYRRWGFHVGPIEAATSRISMKAEEDRANKERSGDAGPNIMPFFVRAENPLRLDENRSGRWGVDDIMRAVMEKAEKEGIDGISDDMINEYQNDAFDIDSVVGVKPSAGDIEFDPNEEVRSWSDVNEFNVGERSDLLKVFLQQLGYDSIVYKNDFEGGGDSYIVFTPNQVKSATGNVGGYDTKNFDIRYSLRTSFATPEAAERAAYKKAAPSTPEFKLFFGGSLIMDEGRPQPMFHASPNEFETFSEFKPIFVSPDAEKAQNFSALKRLGRGAKRDYIYPLWVRAETPFDYENPVHVQTLINKMGDLMGMNELIETEKEIKRGNWSKIEDPRTQAMLKNLGFDSFYVFEGQTKNLAVFKAEQVKSITGNIGDFSLESKDMRFSLKKFNKEDLPEKKRDYILPQDTLLYHGAYKERADRIDEMGSVLLSRPPMRVSGGAIDEGGLIFFGDEDTARQFAENRGDPMAVEAARKAGVERLTGKVFETVTDRPYKLIYRNYKMNAKEAKALTEALGLPDYKSLDAGDSLGIATGRALDYGRSTIDRYEVIKRTGQGKETISAPWPVIFRTLGVDGFYDSLGVALTANNGIKLIGKDGKLERYSLPTIPQAVQDRMGETTTTRERKTVIQNIIDAIRPTSAADFRAKYLNRYNQMSVYDKKRAEQMGGAALLADQSAESAALMSDLGAGVAASAMGFDDRNGGIPVLRNGITTIDKKVKGLIASLAPLAAQGDPAVYQRYQYWAMVKRGQRLNKEGRLTGIDNADVAFADILEQAHPEFVNVQKDLVAFNNGLVKYMVDTGVLSKERGEIYTKHADYIPFYRQMDGENTLGPNLFQSLSGVKPPKKLKGAVADEAPLADFLETMVRNTQSSIQAGIKNYAAQRALNAAAQVNAPGMGATRLNTKENGPDIINVLEKGELVSYRTPDTLLVNAMMSLNQSELPFIGFLSAPADWLRTLVTKEPGFMMANMLRDSLSAWVTSGQSMTPIAGTVINFGKALARTSPGFEAMLDAGIIGGYEFSENIEQSGFKLEDDLAKKAGKKAPLVLRPFKSVWDALGKGTTASDAATRALIYERVLADTGNEAEALYRSLEVMNFHRKGSSPLIRVLTAAVPFFNARLQGLDLFYRASTGNMNSSDAASIQRQFFMRGFTMMALSGLYWMLVSDDEEYKKQEQETKDNNWIIPSIGVKIPIPFEVGVLFKVIPERIMAYSFGSDTGEDLKKSMMRNAMGTFGFNPIPQTVKPILETVVDYNMFTMRPILSPGMKDIEPEFQVGPSTSNFATALAQSLGLSPIKVDHIIKGYTGTIGMYAIDTIDIVMDQFGDSPKPTKRFEQLPVIKRFASDPEARGFVTQYYELKDAVDTTVRTMNLLEKTAQPEEYTEYLIKNQGTLAFKDYVRDTEKTMTELREIKIAIRASTMTGDEKRDALLEISRVESAITSNIQEIKKAISEVQ